MSNKAYPCILIVTALVFFCADCVHGQPVDRPSVVIRNVWFEDETGALVHTNVVVNGGRVTRIASIPAGATVIDGGGARVSVGPDGVVTLTPVEVKTLQANGTAPALPRVNPTLAPQAEENLASKVVDPTAPLKTITFQNKFSPSLWGLNDEQNETDMQIAVPLHFLGRANILRVTIHI